MADIPGIPMPEPRKRAKMARVTTSKRWIDMGPLVPWMHRYALWLAEHPDAWLTEKGGKGGYRGYPTRAQRTAKASAEAKRKISGPLCQRLEQRDDFRAYFQKLREDAAFKAKQVADRDIVFNLEARGAALRSVANKVTMPDGTERWVVDDPKIVEQMTRPYLELAYPKKGAETEKPPTIVLHLGSGDAKKLLGLTSEPEAVDVEYEIIENEKLLEAGDDDS
jgi:hypothetical protein